MGASDQSRYDDSDDSPEAIELRRITAEGNAHQFIVGSGTLAVQEAMPTPRVPVPRQLPSDIAVFTGRVHEIDRLDRLLAATDRDTALNSVLINGTAGVGKTGLAIHWGHRVRERFTDGDLYIDLHGYGPDRPVEPMEALAHLLGSFGLRENELPQRLTERAGHYRSLLYGKRVLIVLDNVSSIEQIRELLPGSATCAVLVTSRDRLDGFTARYGAPRIALDVLKSDDAIQLLTDIIGQRAHAEPNAIHDLAEVCGNHTLALRIAATNAANRLDTTLSVLIADLRAAFDRNDLAPLSTGDDPHTDLRAVYSWSLEHLTERARHAFALVGLCPANTIDLYGLSALLCTDLEAARRLSNEIVRAHLLTPDAGGRFAMHDLLRSYARHVAGDQLTAEARRAAIGGYLAYHAVTASQAMDQYVPFEHPLRPEPPAVVTATPVIADESSAIAWLDSERSNLIATALYAADHGRPDHTCHIAFTIFRYLDTCGNLYHNQQLQSVAFRSANRLSQRGRALEHLGVVVSRLARYEDAADCYRRAIDFARQAGNTALEAANICNLGFIYGKFARPEDNLECQQRALEMILQTGPDCEIARVHNLLGSALLELGRHAEAGDHLHTALEMFRAGGGFAFARAMLLNKVGMLRLRTGEPEDALEPLVESRTLFEQMGNRGDLHRAVNNIGNVYRVMDRLGEAEAHHRQALAMARAFSIIDSEVVILNDLGITLAARGRLPEALECHRHALEIARRHGHRLELKRATDRMAAIEAHR